MDVPGHLGIMLASNVCGRCKAQKRKCDKLLPSCTRCVNLRLSCDYDLHISREINAVSSISEFLFFHVPVAAGQLWLPASLQATTLERWTLDIDRFVVRLVMANLGEPRSRLHSALKVYFDSVQPWLPVIHERNFRQRLSQLLNKPRADKVLLLLVIYPLITERVSEAHYHPEQSQTYYLCKYLFSFLQLTRPPCLDMVETGLLFVVYELGNSLSMPPASPLVLQVVTDFQAPHAIQRLEPGSGLPVDDRIWDSLPPTAAADVLQPSLSTPVETPLYYFARKVQTVHLLGQVQALRDVPVDLLRPAEFDRLEKSSLILAQTLFHQNPGEWLVFCGANALALLATMTLQQVRTSRVQRLHVPHEIEKAALDLLLLVNISNESVPSSMPSRRRTILI
ncbi:hypothetical protein Asppvi_001699 [Aspergillus pseudoviridinutans]|uniref:Zn(2)-C6 fungal-type domain-containing protein n=1 Tax=Aspergillus pseudoviridinutans TaxID=1517512 RepID=A0A9P3B3W1_9EURO|nr:uncharacterized protein Asppvi_001699 [Aspergillus pseudoviridinutans]GIJ83180.1 hypothetical protein Asppvi_001699 [Aspergillus pseudoviridinutans]